MITGKIVQYIVRVLLGGSIYYMLENLVRGYSHWSMFILGVVCFLCCGIVNDIAGNSIRIWKKMFYSDFPDFESLMNYIYELEKEINSI